MRSFQRKTTYFFAFTVILLIGGYAFAESSASGQGSLTAWDIILKGGWVMIPLALLSIAAVGLAFHSFLILDPKNILPEDLLEDLIEHVGKGNMAEAENCLSRNDSIAARVFKAGFSVRPYGVEKVSEFLSNAGRREMDALRRRIAVLGYIGDISPLLGLLGTVLGMIRAFRVISLTNDPIVRHEKPYLLASAIWEAMVTTAAGLLVGIFALLLFYYFNGRLQKVAGELEAEAEKFALAISKETKTEDAQ